MKLGLQRFLEIEMLASPKSLSDQIVQHMRRNGLDVLTMRVPAFYQFCERDRLKDGFIDALSGRLAESSVLFVAGDSAVVFVTDFDFAPMKK
jgi:hypothetical protein